MDCLFCRIVHGESPAQVVHSNEEAIVIRDVNPQAPVHLLVIPKGHVADLSQVQDSALIGRLMGTALKVAASEGLSQSGYRVVINTGRDGGQTVFHLHIHILGGRAMAWPPG